jgi:hypothetical protein
LFAAKMSLEKLEQNVEDAKESTKKNKFFTEKIAMNNEEIAKFARSYRLAVAPLESSDSNKERISLDELKSNTFHYLNTAKESDKKGEHWVCYAVLDGVVVYFDSLGMPFRNEYYSIDGFDDRVLQNSKRRLILAGGHFQNPDSALCGEYCCSFLHLLDESNYRQFTHLFDSIDVVSSRSKDIQNNNDEIIAKFFHMILQE